MIAIVNYGVGNLFSLECSLQAIGQETKVTDRAEDLRAADRLILPGVGAFGDAMDKLRASGLDRVIIEQANAGKPLMGICLGMQMLFERSHEYGLHDGLGLLRGEIRPLSEWIRPGLKIPQMGWNALHLNRPEHPLFREIKEGDNVYFVHSYAATDCEDSLLAVTEYGGPVTACVGKKNVCGCQFHPEKSGKIGLNILRAFAETEGGDA